MGLWGGTFCHSVAGRSHDTAYGILHHKSMPPRKAVQAHFGPDVAKPLVMTTKTGWCYFVALLPQTQREGKSEALPVPYQGLFRKG